MVTTKIRKMNLLLGFVPENIRPIRPNFLYTMSALTPVIIHHTFHLLTPPGLSGTGKCWDFFTHYAFLHKRHRKQRKSNPVTTLYWILHSGHEEKDSVHCRAKNIRGYPNRMGMACNNHSRALIFIISGRYPHPGITPVPMG